MRPLCCLTAHGQCIKEMEDVGDVVDQFQDDLEDAESLAPSTEAYQLLFFGPKVGAAPTYSLSQKEVMVEPPISEDEIFHLRPREAIQAARLSVHSNGFRVCVERCREPIVSCSWSPFSLVENCQVRANKNSTLAIFKLTVFTYRSVDRSYYFTTKGDNALSDREKWVNLFKERVQAVTVSLFPPHAIVVRPVHGMTSTQSRIMAGYLLWCLGEDRLSLVYCELQSYAQGLAQLSIYKDESCDPQESTSVCMVYNTVVSSRKGAHCTTFGIDAHRFCARTLEEKDLWLRAVSNVKVKLIHDAPEPTRQELDMFRAAVLERVIKLRSNEVRPGGDPLLPRAPRLPVPMTPTGDLCLKLSSEACSEPTEDLAPFVTQQSWGTEECGNEPTVEHDEDTCEFLDVPQLTKGSAVHAAESVRPDAGPDEAQRVRLRPLVTKEMKEVIEVDVDQKKASWPCRACP